ncbi:MAG: hypothetical protein EHM81_09470, partial [Chloroflexi bacterium]
PVDIGAVQTHAVETVVFAVTQTAAAFTPTPLPLPPTETPVPPTVAPTATPAATGTATPNICNNLEFIVDATVPDGTTMTPGQEFVKTWKVKNTGSCTWTTGYTIIWAYGEKMGGQTTALTAEVLPNTEAEVSITLTAPAKAGTYSGYWRLRSNNGENFGTQLTVVIVVQ